MAPKKETPKVAELIFQGNSLEELKRFPKPIQYEFGGDLWQLQQGNPPLKYRPMSSVDRGVFELKQRDDAGAYRVIYLSRVDDVIYVLHSFVKKTQKTSKRDLEIATARLKEVQVELREKRK